MKLQALKLAGALLIAAALPAAAYAHGPQVGVTIGFGSPPVVYYPPRPPVAYYPPVYYYPPPAVIIRPWHDPYSFAPKQSFYGHGHHHHRQGGWDGRRR